ncbi:copper chaperone CopZ [Virgibacillus soli]|uniref:Copper chaperone CopZ n=1 Tax=Paracerasibacillus soli TaxID=480284 RepID=A0ABU5CV67_9BACI|nr:copper chaperone CopZ [Virgibacillus soli]MDY0410221.1 copper chaperone CopZ [Virgibacillus soli]
MKATINVKGMSCGHCVSSVNGALEQLDGVDAVEVSLETGKVDVSYDESKVTLTQLQDAIEEQGYDVVK